MAEHYGVVPKRFTKEWWPYFWMYYKWQTIGIALAILIIAVTIVQCATKEKYDVTVNYIGETYFSEEVVSNLELVLEPLIEDVDGNGENNLFFQQLTLTNKTGSEEMDYALQMKHDVELSGESSFLYMYDTSEAKLMLARETADDVYMKLSDWVTEDIPEDRILLSDSGEALAISAEGSKLLESAGMNTENLYIAIRINYSDEDTNKAAQRSAIAMANAILK